MVFVFGYPAGESEEPIFSGRVAGTVSDTLQFPIREIRDNEIRQTIPSSALFLRQPSNIKDTIIYDPLTKRYVVASLIGGKYYYNRPFMETLQDLLKARSKMSLYEYNRRQIQEGNKYDFKSLVSDIQFLRKIAGITSKNRRDDAKCLNINVVTVTNDAKAEKRKTQRKAEYRKRTVFKSLPDKR